MQGMANGQGVTLGLGEAGQAGLSAMALRVSNGQQLSEALQNLRDRRGAALWPSLPCLWMVTLGENAVSVSHPFIELFSCP